MKCITNLKSLNYILNMVLRNAHSSQPHPDVCGCCGHYAAKSEGASLLVTALYNRMFTGFVLDRVGARCRYGMEAWNNTVITDVGEVFSTALWCGVAFDNRLISN